MVKSKAHRRSDREIFPIYVAGMPCLVHFLADVRVGLQHGTVRQ